MNIWLINHYAVPTKYYPLSRPATFAKYLMRMGHSVSIFAASTVHNSDKNLITDGSPYREETVDGIHYVYIRTSAYAGNGFRRIINMLQFPRRLWSACRKFKKPDTILATSVTPMACMTGLRLAKKYGCTGVAEIADLWPETFVAYGLLSAKSPLTQAMYMYEKHLYQMADRIIFTMEGGSDYIKNKAWDTEHGGVIETEKIFHINNGVDLQKYREDIAKFRIADSELDDPDTFKVIYVGAVRRVNGLEMIVDTAERLREVSDIRFLIYGEGDERESLTRLCHEKGLDNISFKGAVDKEFIPYVLSKSDLNLIHVTATSIMRYGCSLNKLFDYFASGKPIISDLPVEYDLIKRYNAGLTLSEQSSEMLADAIRGFFSCDMETYSQMCEGSKRAAADYDFEKLTHQLITILKPEDKPEAGNTQS